MPDEEVDHSEDQEIIPDPNFVEAEEVEEDRSDWTIEELMVGKGLPDGTVVGNSKIVYEYDDDNEFVGWHKEVVDNG